METKSVKAGEVLAKRGDAIESIWVILDGSVCASNGGMELNLKKGDFVGLCDFDHGEHSLDYVATSPSKIMSFATIDSFLETDFYHSKADTSRAIVLSMNHITRDSYAYVESMCIRHQKLCKLVKAFYKTYIEYSHELHNDVRLIDDIDDITEPIILGNKQKSMSKMHKGFAIMLADHDNADEMITNNIISGYMYHLATDFQDAMSSMDYISFTLKDCEDVLLSESGDDLFERFEELYLKLSLDHPRSADIKRVLEDICEASGETRPEIANERKLAFEKKCKSYSENKNSLTENNEDNSDVASKLVGSMETIFKFASYSDEYAQVIRETIREFRKKPDPFSSDADVIAIRRTLEDNFYHLYLAVLEATMDSGNCPTIISMFLNFGYLDENLVGIENACNLYHIAQTYKGNPAEHIYTGQEWLSAIFSREREPSINEFGQTFEEYIHEMAANGRIQKDHVKLYLKERGQMVMFELQNMFRRASRMCSGKVTTFCPILFDKQFFRGPTEEILNPHDIVEVRNGFRKIDYSLFYREQVCVFNKKENIHDVIHVEVLPDIVLLPLVGTRGAMWQEIVGRDKMTPARMLLPIFGSEDLEKMMLRMFAEYRWEMCKREQGMRWNDVTSPSLTSLYYDYLQFYRKNSDINTEQKEKIKIGLQKSKNNFKEYFINDYIQYIKYESNGSPHLNKVARYILFTQCPFSATIRLSLSDNPIYNDVSEKYRFYTSKSLHRLENIVKKLTSKGLDVPKDLVRELEFYNL